MGPADRWVRAPKPYLRTLFLIAGVVMHVPTWLLIYGFARLTTSEPTTQAEAHALAHSGPAMFMLIVPLGIGVLSIAHGLTYLGAAVPGRDRRPPLALPSGDFLPSQRKLLATGGMFMLGAASVVVIVGLFVPVIALLLGYFVLPLFGLAGYAFALGALLEPLGTDERTARKEGIALLVVVALAVVGTAVATWMDGRLDTGTLPLALTLVVLAAFPAAGVLAGYVPRGGES